MKFLIIFLFLLSNLFQTVLAENCPLPSQLVHNANDAWQVDPVYLNRGWKVDSTIIANRSNWHVMPDNIQLYIQLYPQNPYEIKATCMYYISGKDMWAVFVRHTKMFDPKGIPVPPFKKTDNDSFRCDTTAANAAECAWQNGACKSSQKCF